MTPSNDDFDHEAALAACARGERFAFQALYQKESRWLLGVATRIVRDPDLAHDVLHDAFLQVWQKASTYQPELGSARGWIYTVVRHRALDIARRSGREQLVGDALEGLADGLQTRHDTFDTAQDPHALDHCLGLLDEDKRRCVIDACVEGYTHEELAREMNRPIGTIKSWIRRGLIALKECLS